KEIARREGVSINQFISTAVSEKISAIMTEDYLMNRAKRAQKGTLKQILDKVPDREPLPGDEL
ncbi:MAG: toxin-antitoxin system HicB family antitoxin, partial [bacterium]|nr:toxin-antitoxin system HicB family antitoxin [bacterium]